MKCDHVLCKKEALWIVDFLDLDVYFNSCDMHLGKFLCNYFNLLSKNKLTIQIEPTDCMREYYCGSINKPKISVWARIKDFLIKDF